VYNALATNPIQNIHITSTTRSAKNDAGSGEHASGLAVDLADDNAGLEFYNWITSRTPEVEAWKKQHNFDYIMYHENASGSGYHYHVKFK
jgi:hypothetical protein